MHKTILGFAALALIPAAALSQASVDDQRAALAAEERGDAATALAAADRLENAARAAGAAGQALRITAWQVRSQFSSSADFLARPEPTSDQPEVRPVWRALRIAVLARDGQVGPARDELKLMRLEGFHDKLAGNSTPQARIAEHVAVARIDFAMKNYRGAAERFTRAAEIEAKADAGATPVWHQPLDSALGAALLKAGDARAAYAAFGRALARRPDSPWVLWGRAQAERGLGNAAASSATLGEVDKRWRGDRSWLTLDRL